MKHSAVALFKLLTLMCFPLHSNDMTSYQSISTEDVMQRRAIHLSPQCGDVTSCIRQATFLISKENVHNFR